MSVSLYFLLFRLLAVCKNKSVCVIIKLNNIEFGESSMLTSKMEYMGCLLYTSDAADDLLAV